MKKVLLAVTSGIACYKALDVCSGLKKKGYDVTVIMSKNASKLISPLLFQILTGNKVHTELFSLEDTKVTHINLIKENDLVVIVPATLNIISKLACGINDDFISTTLSATDPYKTLIFPAMNTRMYEGFACKENLEKLRKYGFTIIEPDSGLLACGDTGKGKLPQVNDIIDEIVFNLEKINILKGKNILITAGGTKEKIDPVRYITNKSSGKMGYALARQAAFLGANVTLISTDTNLNIPNHLKTFIKVSSAEQMYNEVMNYHKNQDLIIMAAAVSDFKVKNYSEHKIKKSEMKELKLDLELNKDILFELSKIEPRDFILVGFAAESQNLKENALKKLKNKNLDYIIANDISNQAIGFDSDLNKVFIYDKELNESEIEINTKDIVAKSILINIFDKL